MKTIDFICAVYTAATFFGCCWLVNLFELPLWAAIPLAGFIWVVLLFVSILGLTYFIFKDTDVWE